MQVDFVLQELRCQEQHTSGGKAKLNCLSFKVQGSKGARFNLKSSGFNLQGARCKLTASDFENQIASLGA